MLCSLRLASIYGFLNFISMHVILDNRPLIDSILRFSLLCLTCKSWFATFAFLKAAQMTKFLAGFWYKQEILVHPQIFRRGFKEDAMASRPWIPTESRIWHRGVTAMSTTKSRFTSSFYHQLCSRWQKFTLLQSGSSLICWWLAYL